MAGACAVDILYCAGTWNKNEKYCESESESHSDVNNVVDGQDRKMIPRTADPPRRSRDMSIWLLRNDTYPTMCLRDSLMRGLEMCET